MTGKQTWAEFFRQPVTYGDLFRISLMAVVVWTTLDFLLAVAKGYL